MAASKLTISFARQRTDVNGIITTQYNPIPISVTGKEPGEYNDITTTLPKSGTCSAIPIAGNVNFPMCITLVNEGTVDIQVGFDGTLLGGAAGSMGTLFVIPPGEFCHIPKNFVLSTFVGVAAGPTDGRLRVISEERPT